MKATEWTEAFASGKMDDKLSLLYGNAKATLEQQRQRYVDAIQAFTELYPEREDLYIYSAPGRTEVGGNHTDHQHGCVLAAAVNLDAIAIVSFHEDQVIRLKSANYPQDVVDLTDLSVHLAEMGKSAALIRGIAARFAEMGVSVSGFDAYTTSSVLSGSGLSSSAAFGADQQTMECRCYGLARHYHPFLVNTVVGFMGPEYIYDTKQLTRAALEDVFCGHLHGLPMGCDVCYTNHMPTDQNDSETILTLLGTAGVHYVMGLPQADDIMLMYQSTSYHDVASVRQLLKKHPIPEFRQWLEKWGFWENGHLGRNAGDPSVFFAK